MTSRFAYARAVALRPDSDPRRVVASVEAVRRGAAGGVVLSIDTARPPTREVALAAARAVEGANDALLSVRGEAGGFDPGALTVFRHVPHLDLNANGLREHRFLSSFHALRTLVVQGASSGPVDLGFVEDLPLLARLTTSGRVKGVEAVGRSPRLEFLGLSSQAPLLEAMAGHPTLRSVDIAFGSRTDLGPLATMPSLRAAGLFRIGGLTGDDLAPLGRCEGLQALWLGAVRNVTHLAALRERPASTLRALLLEQVPQLSTLGDVGACAALTELGLYESRPRDRRLAPLMALTELSSLVLGDVYPREELETLDTWYSGSLHYRNSIARGERRPQWRTPIDELGPPPR